MGNFYRDIAEKIFEEKKDEFTKLGEFKVLHIEDIMESYLNEHSTEIPGYNVSKTQYDNEIFNEIRNIIEEKRFYVSKEMAEKLLEKPKEATSEIDIDLSGLLISIERAVDKAKDIPVLKKNYGSFIPAQAPLQEAKVDDTPIARDKSLQLYSQRPKDIKYIKQSKIDEKVVAEPEKAYAESLNGYTIVSKMVYDTEIATIEIREKKNSDGNKKVEVEVVEKEGINIDIRINKVKNLEGTIEKK